jgi:DNA-binding NarL/FixJ family response regulator
MTDNIRVMIIEDDQLIRESLAILIDGTPDFSCVGKTESVEDFFETLQDTPVDVLLLDIDLPGTSGIDAISAIKERMPDTDILMMTVHDNPQMVFNALKRGANGYLTKNMQPLKILDAIREVRSGGAPMSTHIARMVIESFQTTVHNPLSEREQEVLRLLCQGLSYRSIADKLFISEDTVHFHIKNIYKKLHVHSKAEAVSKAYRDRLV